MAAIADNLQAVKARIGSSGGVTLLAVSKGQDADKVRQAAAAGQRAFGENYVQDALEKMDLLPGLEWHLIGPLQSNKTRVVAERFQWVQTLDREKIARRLSEQRPAALAPLNVLVQVNISGEASKSGVAAGEIAGLLRSIASMPRLRARGLMAIPDPLKKNALEFREMKKIFDHLKEEFHLDTLSMGMTDDLELAIAEGSTMVRVGTAIFGSRQSAKDIA
jgi:pyridoxal phosphate enzyme (YggS family)